MNPAAFKALDGEPTPEGDFGAVDAALQASVHPGQLTLVTGPTGTGKVTLAFKAALGLRDQGRAAIFAPREEGIISAHERAAFHAALHGARAHDQIPIVILPGMRFRDDALLAGALLDAGVAVISFLHLTRPHGVQGRLGQLSGAAHTATALAARLSACVGLLRHLPKLCPECSRPAELTEQERAVMAGIGVCHSTLRMRGAGSSSCNGLGRHRRWGHHPVFETLLPNAAMRRAAADGVSDAFPRALECPTTRAQVLHSWGDSVRSALNAGTLDPDAITKFAAEFGPT